MFPEEQVRLMNLLIECVQMLSDGIDIVWREVGWKELAGELVPETIGGEMLEMEAWHEPDGQEASTDRPAT